MTYMVAQDGKTATQDVYEEPIVGPCLVLDLKDRATYYDPGDGSAEDGGRTLITSGADIDGIRDSLDQSTIPRGVNPNGLNFDYTATKPGVYWVNNGESGGTYPDDASYGILAVFKTPNDVMQLFSNEMGLWHRMNVNDRWCTWQKLN